MAQVCHFILVMKVNNYNFFWGWIALQIGPIPISGYISQLGSNKPTQHKVHHFSISKYRYHKCGERRWHIWGLEGPLCIQIKIKCHM
jgi:hypothetical protein